MYYRDKQFLPLLFCSFSAKLLQPRTESINGSFKFLDPSIVFSLYFHHLTNSYSIKKNSYSRSLLTHIQACRRFRLLVTVKQTCGLKLLFNWTKFNSKFNINGQTSKEMLRDINTFIWGVEMR